MNLARNPAVNRDFVAELDAAIGCQQCGGSLDNSPSTDFCSPRCQAAWSAARVQPLTTYVEPDDQPEHVANLVELHSPETCVACVEGRSHGLRPPWLLEPTFMEALRVAARRRRAENFRRLYLNGLVPAVPVVPFTDPEPPAGTADRGALVRHTNEPCQVEPLISGQVRIAPAGEPPDPDSPNWRAFGQVREGFAIGIDPATREGGGSLVALRRRDGVDHVEVLLSPGAVVFPPEFVERMRAVNEQIGQAWTDAWRNIAEAVRPFAEHLERSGVLEEQPPEDPRERALWLRQHRNTGPAVQARAPRAINPRRRR